MNTKKFGIALLVAAIAVVSGCSAMANMPVIQEKLKIVSAGYTGCMPEENELSNLAFRPDGSGTWNASCKGKTYLCSTVATTSAQTYHCALVPQ